jgi:hypothetical protein
MKVLRFSTLCTGRLYPQKIFLIHGWLSRYSDWLRAGRSGVRIPVGGEIFRTRPEGAHPASCTVGTGSFPGLKRQGRGADHPPPSSAEVENEYSYTSTPLWAFGACGRVNLRHSGYQGCTVPGRHVAWATKFCMLAPNICWSSVWTLLHVTLLAPIISRWLIDFPGTHFC